MPRSIICISRSGGSGGDAIARLVAKDLGYRYVDEEIVRRAAELAGVSTNEVEQAEHSRPLITRILEALSNVPSASEIGYVAPLPAVAPPATQYSHLIEHVVRETAEAKDVVIVAHGASHVLAGRAEVLRVFVTGSPEQRAARLASESGSSEKEATKAIGDADKERAGYLDRFYKVKQELPVHYDLTLNTDNMTPEGAAALVVAAAKA